jgi:hypothetical protein
LFCVAACHEPLEFERAQRRVIVYMLAEEIKV